MAGEPDPASHWDQAYARGETAWSWFEDQPGMSLRMLESAGVAATDAVIDVGGGASSLAQLLLDRGFRDITVLDVSVTGMQHARQHLGSGELGGAWRLTSQDREEHITPAGLIQPFTWVALRRLA
jgi:hypothetical protein